MIGVPSRVQDLHRDLATFGVHSISKDAVLAGFAAGRELAGKRFYPAGAIGCVAARDDQTDLAAGAFGEIGCEAIVLVAILEPRVHGTHKHTVPERRETEVQWREEMWVGRVGQ